MRDYLTDREVELLLCFADYEMQIRPTARAMKIDRRTIGKAFETIFRETGYNPLEFWDLHQIMKTLEQEEENDD